MVLICFGIFHFSFRDEVSRKFELPTPFATVGGENSFEDEIELGNFRQKVQILFVAVKYLFESSKL